MEEEQILSRIRNAALGGNVRISLHAAEGAMAEEISRDEILEVMAVAKIIEEYPTWWLGPCALLHGRTGAGRDLHFVCSHESLPVVVVTVYEPKPPKWVTPTRRGGKT